MLTALVFGALLATTGCHFQSLQINNVWKLHGTERTTPSIEMGLVICEWAVDARPADVVANAVASGACYPMQVESTMIATCAMQLHKDPIFRMAPSYGPTVAMPALRG